MNIAIHQCHRIIAIAHHHLQPLTPPPQTITSSSNITITTTTTTANRPRPASQAMKLLLATSYGARRPPHSSSSN